MANFNTDENINPDSPMNVRVQPRVRTVQFGDGYEMSVQDGLNADLRIYDLTFTNVTTAQADSINNFIAMGPNVSAIFSLTLYYIYLDFRPKMKKQPRTNAYIS